MEYRRNGDASGGIRCDKTGRHMCHMRKHVGFGKDESSVDANTVVQVRLSRVCVLFFL